jgi:hypothetical protein
MSLASPIALSRSRHRSARSSARTTPRSRSATG